MGLKERGLTVGDLLIIVIIIISSTFIIKKFNQNNQTSFNLDQPEIISLKGI